MHPKQFPKLLLSLLLSFALYTPAVVANDEKSTASPNTGTVKAPSAKPAVKPTAKPKTSNKTKAETKAETKTKAKPKKVKSNKKHKQQRSARHPKPGMSMKQVRKHYGEPKSVRKSKGKVKKLWPRITVWNYGPYSVYFERHIVLHTVVH